MENQQTSGFCCLPGKNQQQQKTHDPYATAGFINVRPLQAVCFKGTSM